MRVARSVSSSRAGSTESSPPHVASETSPQRRTAPMTYRILVTTDFSPPSDYAVHFALGMLSRTTGAELHIGHVVASSRTHIEQDERLLRDAQDQLRSFIEATQAGANSDGSVK